MSEERIGQWGVTLRICWSKEGYQWEPDGVLRPTWRSATNPDEPHRLGQEMTQVASVKACRMAFNYFLRFAREVENGITPEQEDEARAVVLQRASLFGTLYAGEEGQQDTLEAWLREACAFLDLHDASQAARSSVGSRKIERFQEGMRCVTPELHAYVYESGRAYSPVMPITAHEDTLRKADGQVFDFSARAAKAGAKAMALAMIEWHVRQKLAGGMSFEPDRFSEGRFIVSPKNLICMLYLRLWLDTVDAPEPLRECPCGKEIKGARNKVYCSDACKQKYYRRRRG